MTYESLVASALLGTARRPPDIAVPLGAPDDLAAALGARPPEEALLAAAAAWSVARRAGAVAGPSSPPEAAPPDPRPLCPPAAARTLETMLEGVHTDLVPEWLELVAAAGRRPPPELLPALLDLADERPELRAAATAAAGPRADWLAARSSRADDIELVWDKGSRYARLELLATVRRGDPAAGRALLESTWEGETAEDRAAFLAALAHGLGPDDEPFLEAVLDDRRKPVRQAAADLLWSLHGSQLGARMAERAAPLVRIGRRLDVTLPAECDKAMERDGIERKPPRGTGERQFWLAQLVEATPLSTWPIEAAAKKGEWRDLLRAAWARAAVRQRDVEWARALLGVHPALLGVLPKDEREAAARSLEDALACPGPWGPKLSRQVLKALRADDVVAPEEIATRLHPDTLEDAEALREHGHRRFCDLAAFRAGMLRDLR